MCEACMYAASGKMDLHHRKIRSQGGEHTKANLVWIHDYCHRYIHENPTLAYRLGWLVRSYLDPRNVPYHHFGSLTVWAEQ